MRRLLGIFIAMGVVLVAAVAVMYAVGLAALNVNRAVARQQTVLGDIAAFRSTMLDAETRQRGFLLTGDDQFLESYDQALARSRDELLALDAQARRGEVRAEDVRALSALAERRIAMLGEGIRARSQGGPEAASAAVRAGQGKPVMDDIRALLDRMREREQGELSQIRSKAARLGALRTRVFALTGALCLGFIAWAYRRLKRELTGRIKAAAEVEQQRNLLGVTLSSIGDGVLVTDTRGRITFLNGVAEQLTGWTSAQASGQPCGRVFNIINEDTRLPVESPVDRVLAGGRVVGLANHTLLIRKDGSEIPIDDSGAPVRDLDGTLRGVILVFRDFSDRKESERRIQKLNEDLRRRVAEQETLFSVAPVGLAVAEDPACRRMRANPALALMLDIPPASNASKSAPPGERPENFVPMRDGREVPAEELPIQQAARTGRPVTLSELDLVFADGRRVTVLGNATPLFGEDGAVRGAIGAFADISELKRIEGELRRTEQRFRVALQHTPISVYTNDRALRYTWIHNPRFDFTPEQILGKTDEELLPPESVAELVGMKRHVIETGQGARRQIVAPVLGQERAFDVTAEPLRDEAGNVTGVIVATYDVTEVIQAKREAEAASKAKDMFLAMLSHELRTPLTPVMSTLSAWEFAGELPPKLREDVQMLRRNLDLEVRLIDDLLDVTRIAKGRLALRPEVADVHDLLDAVVRMYQSDVHDKGLHLTLRLGAGRSFVHADPARLQQVLWNLLKNATKFTPAGGGVVVATENDAAGRFRLSVTDSGIGLTREQLSRLFQPFEQATADTFKFYGGLGLGLTIAKALVEAHGGTIEAASEGPGTGATFTLTLPTVDPPATGAASGGGTGDRGLPTEPLAILLVEDHSDTARAMSVLMRSMGHGVRIAGTLEGALQLVRSEPFDVLMSDIGLPDGTGLDLIRAMRKQHGGATMPAVALTGYGTDEDVDACLQAGFTSHLTKPVNLQKLEMILRHVPKRRRDIHHADTPA